MKGVGPDFVCYQPGGLFAMFFLRSSGPAPLGPSDSMQTVSPASMMLVCAPLFWPAQPTAENWQAIYRVAYEQFMVAIAPSPFQRALEPSLN